MKSLNNTILEDTVLVILTRLIYEVHCWDDFRWHDMLKTLHGNWYGHSGNIWVNTLTIWGVSVLVSLVRGFLPYDFEAVSGGMIYIGSPITIFSGIRAILRRQPQQYERLQFWKYRWEGFITYEINMDSGGMICAYEVSWRLIQAFEQH
jgi:hypothetical protein